MAVVNLVKLRSGNVCIAEIERVNLVRNGYGESPNEDIMIFVKNKSTIHTEYKRFTIKLCRREAEHLIAHLEYALRDLDQQTIEFENKK